LEYLKQIENKFERRIGCGNDKRDYIAFT